MDALHVMPIDDGRTDCESLRDILRSTTAPFGTPGHVTHDLLAQIISRSSQAFVIGFPDGSLGMMNEAFEQLTGYTAEELKNISWETMLTPPEWRELERLKLEELNKTRRPVRYEKEYIKKNGTRIPIELHVHLLSDTQGIYYCGFLTDISERKNAEEALRQSEERFRSVLENSTDFCYRFNLQTNRFDYASPSAESVTSYTATEYMALDSTESFELIHADDLERVRDTIANLSSNVKAVVEYRLLAKNGQYRWISNHMMLVKDAATGEVYRYGSARNITDEKFAQQDIRNTTDLLLSILDTSPDCIYRYNLQTQNYDYFSPACESLLGLTPPELKAMDMTTVLSAVHSDDRELSPSAMEKREVSGPEEFEYRRFVAGRGYRWFSDKIKLVRDSSSDLLYRYGIIRDVTDRIARDRHDRFLSGLAERTEFLNSKHSIVVEMLRSLGEFLSANRCMYIEMSEADGLVHVQSEWAHDGTRPNTSNSSLPIFRPTAVAALRGGQQLVVSDLDNSGPNDADHLILSQQSAKSFVFTPIHSDGKWLSILAVFDVVPRNWREEEVALLRTVAERTRLKIENVRPIDDLRRQSVRAKYLSEASILLNASLDYETTLATVAKLAVPRFADWCVIDIVDNATNTVQHVALEHVDPAKVALGWELRARYPTDLNSSTGLGGVLRTGKSAFVPLVTENMIRAGAKDETHYRLLIDLGLSSVMIVPLAIRDRVFGALSLIGTKESGRIFTEEDLRVAEDIGVRAGVAIENSRLYKQVRDEELKQRRIAETLQVSLMVSRSSADFEGLIVDTHYEAALDESFIGGDFGDVFRVDDTRVALTIGDCTGKGLGAARFVGECQFVTRAFMRESPCEPGEALFRVNRMLQDDQRYDGRPVTALACMAIAVIDTRTGAATVASGGLHPPIVYRSKSEQVEEVPVDGPMLGVQDSMIFGVVNVQLQDGDILVLTTDGVNEARNPTTRKFYGYERLLNSIQNLGKSQGDLNGFAKRIAEDAKRFAEGHLTDDACVIVGKWNKS